MSQWLVFVFLQLCLIVVAYRNSNLSAGAVERPHRVWRALTSRFLTCLVLSFLLSFCRHDTVHYLHGLLIHENQQLR
jgi:hypothetical protein